MMSESCWTTLGIAQTSDEAVIRQAYAARLKVTRPDDDPNGFRALRAAFETARRLAQTRPPPPPAPPRGGESFNIDGLREAAARSVELREAQSARARIGRALRGGQLLDAAVLWRDAVDSLVLPLRDQPHLSEAVARAVLARLPQPAELDQIITRMEWQEEARHFSARTSVVEVMARQAALNWFADLTAAANQKLGLWRRSARQRRWAARILLLPAPGPVRRLLPLALSRPAFQSWWEGINRHSVLLDGKLSPERIAWCRRTTKFWPTLIVRFLRTAIFLVMLPILSALIATFIGVLHLLFVADPTT